MAKEALIKTGKPAIPFLAEVLKNDEDFTLCLAGWLSGPSQSHWEALIDKG